MRGITGAMSEAGQGRGRRLADFIGAWRLEREIRHADGALARFDGRAEWRAEADGALCVETGTLTLPDGMAVQAERRYLWDADLQVRFADGRFFHAVPPSGGKVAHDCPPDRYEATYDFGDWPNWRCKWRVRGPRKDYVMHGRYVPER